MDTRPLPRIDPAVPDKRTWTQVARAIETAMSDRILILDFGSQFTQPIARLIAPTTRPCAGHR